MSDDDLFDSVSDPPVSDVDEAEMEKLMADIGDMDDDLFKDNLKSASGTGSNKKTTDKKDVKQNLTIEKKKRENSSNNKGDFDDNDEDWDAADDLLISDDEKKQPIKSRQNFDSKKEPEGIDGKESIKNNEAKKFESKKKLMDDLFIDSSAKMETDSKSPAKPVESKKDKSKLMDDLFGDSSASKLSPKKSSPQSAKVLESKQQNLQKKKKDEISFDDDDDLFGGFGDAKTKIQGSVSQKKSGGSYMDSLLDKPSPSLTPQKPKVTEFVLEEKYKTMSRKEDSKKEDDMLFGSYAPSVEKTNSPRKKTPKKSGIEINPFDFVPDSRRKRGEPFSKSFEVDDDDILGNLKSRRSKTRNLDKELRPQEEVNHEQSVSKSKEKESIGSQKNINQKPQKTKSDDWLFGDSTADTINVKKEFNENNVTASIERNSSTDRNIANEAGDWLGNLLSTKRSPSKVKEASTPTHESHNGKFSPQILEIASNQSYTMPIQDTTNVTKQVDNSINTSSVNPNSTSQIENEHSPAKPSLSNVFLESTQNVTPSPNLPLTSPLQQNFLQPQFETNALLSQMTIQQQQNEAEMAKQQQQFQLEQQKLMQEVLKQQHEVKMKQYQEALSGMPNMILQNTQLKDSLNTSSNDEEMKNIQVFLRNAECEVAKLKAELDLVRQQHKDEVQLMEETQQRKMDLEKGVWDRMEERLKAESLSLYADFQKKIKVLEEERQQMISTHEISLLNIKEEWSRALETTKQLYSGLINQMKEEHDVTLKRITELKDMELKAIMTSSGHAKDVEIVMGQLENNTSTISNITAVLQERQGSSHELAQRALKIKEKQLQDYEAQLSASRAEAENERARLTALVHRLENTLVQQGSETEGERWRLAQERMKIEVEKNSIAEERRHLQMNLKADHRNLVGAQENLLVEQRSLMKLVAQQKRDNANYNQSNINQNMTTVANNSTNNIDRIGLLSNVNINADILALEEENMQLKKRLADSVFGNQSLKIERDSIEGIGIKLEEERASIKLEKDLIAQERQSLSDSVDELNSRQHEFELQKIYLQERLSQLAQKTQDLYYEQDQIVKERKKLESIQQEMQSTGVESVNLIALYSEKLANAGIERTSSQIKLQTNIKSNLSPSAVLSRLAAAKIKENQEYEKRLQEISALESY